MKIRNKKTGEIGKLHCDMNVSPAKYGVFEDTDIRGHYWEYHSLAELNEEWEDAPEEPKDFWFIDADGEARETTYLSNNDKSDLRNFDNYFETKEEAEEAVKKLKAWKRLNGEIVGWSFSYNLDLNGCGFDGDDIVVGIKLPRDTTNKDLDLLFGGEE